MLKKRWWGHDYIIELFKRVSGWCKLIQCNIVTTCGVATERIAGANASLYKLS